MLGTNLKNTKYYHFQVGKNAGRGHKLSDLGKSRFACYYSFIKYFDELYTYFLKCSKYNFRGPAKYIFAFTTGPIFNFISCFHANPVPLHNHVPHCKA